MSKLILLPFFKFYLLSRSQLALFLLPGLYPNDNVSKILCILLHWWPCCHQRHSGLPTDDPAADVLTRGDLRRTVQSKRLLFQRFLLLRFTMSHFARLPHFLHAEPGCHDHFVKRSAPVSATSARPHPVQTCHQKSTWQEGRRGGWEPDEGGGNRERLTAWKDWSYSSEWGNSHQAPWFTLISTQLSLQGHRIFFKFLIKGFYTSLIIKRTN